MKINRLFKVAIVVMLFFVSCTTMTSVKLLKPAELNIGRVKNIAVMNFDFKGSWDLAGIKRNPRTLKQLGLNILADALIKSRNKKTPKIDPYTAYPGEKVTSTLVAKLVNNGHYSVIEREKLEKIIEEQKLVMSGMIDDSKAAEIGMLAGAEALILGSGDYAVFDEGKWVTYEKKYKDKNGKKKTRKIKKFRITRKVNVNLNLRIVNTTTGQVTTASNLSLANYTSTKSFLGIPISPGMRRYACEADNENDAIKGVPAWQPIVDGLLQKLLNKAVAQIAPHYVRERREILKGDDPRLKSALEYAKRNLWEDAKPLWEEVSKFTKKQDDKVSATYNLGLYYEVNGMLDQAEEYYDKSFKMSGKAKFLDARARIKRRKAELERLKNQKN